jgi:riboflavin kinase/FMN adenylyltransferase
MKVIRDLNRVQVDRDTVLTIGAFDGLHLGHQDLLRRLVRRARQTDRLSGVLTFDPHPRALLSPTNNALCLTTTDDKTAILQQWGLDLLIVLPFTPELARTSARAFMQILVSSLRMSELWVGWDFALGREREGDVRTLRTIGKSMGYAVHEIEPVLDGGVLVSSTRIRNLLAAGSVREAGELLGRYYALQGRVVRGKGRGQQLGFPTANLEPAQACVVPETGVYAAYVLVGNARYLAAVNIGARPTFGDAEQLVEAHLLDFDGDLLGQRIIIQLVERLREQRRFAGADALSAQIARDVARAREVLT